VNTGDGLGGKESLERWTADFLHGELGRYVDEVARVEVHLTDEAKGKHSGEDMRCMLEARLNGHEPLAVQHHADNMNDAIRGAARKLLRALGHTVGKLDRHEHRVRDTIRREPDATEAAPGTELT
jgi:ribosome-associated translation inhibitor RaiA